MSVNVPSGRPDVGAGVTVAVDVAGTKVAVGSEVGVNDGVAVTTTIEVVAVGTMGVSVGAIVGDGDGEGEDVDVAVGVKVGTNVDVGVGVSSTKANSATGVGVLCEAAEPKALVPHKPSAIRATLATPVAQTGR